MKIAFVSDNGATISRHFGRARQYVIVQIEQGREVARESRPKGSCHGHHDSSPVEHGHKHGDGQHEELLAAVADCDVVIAGGMGARMDQRLRRAGLRAIRTPVRQIDEALKTFLTSGLSLWPGAVEPAAISRDLAPRAGHDLVSKLYLALVVAHVGGVALYQRLKGDVLGRMGFRGGARP